MKRQFYIIISVIIACLFMGYIDSVIQPEYFIKSAIKVFLFMGIIFIYVVIFKEKIVKSMFSINKKIIFISICSGIGVYLIIIIGYFLSKEIIDYSNITTQLDNNIGVNAANFIFVALYISIINSLLEELFFRGFAFKTLSKKTSLIFSYIFSSMMFSLYHIAMMIGWFDFYVYILAIAGLMIIGLLFNYLAKKFNSILISWLIHLFANLGINTVALILFGII